MCIQYIKTLEIPFEGSIFIMKRYLNHSFADISCFFVIIWMSSFYPIYFSFQRILSLSLTLCSSLSFTLVLSMPLYSLPLLTPITLLICPCLCVWFDGHIFHNVISFVSNCWASAHTHTHTWARAFSDERRTISLSYITSLSYPDDSRKQPMRKNALYMLCTRICRMYQAVHLSKNKNENKNKKNRNISPRSSYMPIISNMHDDIHT